MSIIVSQLKYEIVKSNLFNTKKKMHNQSKYLNLFLYSLFTRQMEQ